MSTYQRTLHHNIHGPDEPLPVNLASKLRSSAVDPLKRRPKSPLPSLPDPLLQEQKSMTGLRGVNRVEAETSHQQTSGPTSIFLSHSSKTAPKSYPSGLIRKRSSELLLNSDPETVMTRYFPPLESLSDPLDIVERLKREPELGFLYLTPVEERQSVEYNPYNLR